MSGEKVEGWRDLLVWQKAHAAVLAVYRLANEFPAAERFRLVDQLRRAATSVPTHIAEGRGRSSNGESRQFLVIARGSLEETRYPLLLAKDLGYLGSDIYQKIEADFMEISKMLNGLLRSLRA